MDQKLRDRFKIKLHDFTKCDWLEHNNAIAVLEYIEGNVTSLGNIWRNIELNMAAIRADAGKDASASQHAYYEASFQLEQLKSAENRAGQAEKLKKVLQLTDEAIVSCPHVPSTKQLARLYSFRSMALFEAAQPELALVAIKRALDLSPDSTIYHASAARCFIHLKQPQEALRHLKRAILVSDYPRAAEEAANNPPGVEETVNIATLRRLYADVERQVARVNGEVSSSPSVESLGSSVDSDSYDSDKDDIEEDRLEAQKRQPDAYDKPYDEGPKNFTIDYRCAMHGSADVGKGRYFAATEEIPAETPILKERAYSMVILPELQMRRCHYCARDVSNRFWPCSNCSDSVYCGPRCAELDWSLSHHFDCRLTKYWNGRSKSTFHVFKLLNRMGVQAVLTVIHEEEVLRVAKDEDNQQQSGELQQHQSSPSSELYDLFVYAKDREQRFTPEVEKDGDLKRRQYRAQMTLLSHSEKYPVDYLYTNMANAIECAFMACMAQGIEFDQISRQQLLELICHSFVSVRRVLTNAFRWSGRNERGSRIHIATCYLLMSSMFNHSCDPNSEWSIRSGYLTISTIRAVKPGEELTVSYGPTTSDYFEERQKRLLDGYYFQCNCSACVEECRTVLALQCTACPGPVLANPDETSLDSRCLICFEPYAGAKDKLMLLKRARAEVAIKAQLINCGGIDKVAYIASLQQSLEQILGLIYAASNLLIESIYVACKVFRQEGLLTDCLHFGAIVNELLPLKSATSPLVIADPGMAKDETTYSSAAYTSPGALDANIEHLLFWCSVYRAWIDRTECKDEKQWIEMLRFYRRLRKMLKSTIAYKERLFTELGPNAKETFETVGLREEINVLDALKWYKQQELERLKEKYANQLQFELAEVEL